MIRDHFAARLSDLDRRVVDNVPAGGNWRNLPADFQSKRIAQIRRTAAEGLGSRSTYYGRLDWGRPSYTISTYFNRPGNGCYIHPAAPRLISIREAARLQSFPDSYQFTGRGRSRFIQVGNAVPPLLAYALARGFRPGLAVDLFSGAGGFSLGFAWADHQVIAAIDNDASANATLQLNQRDAASPLLVDLGDAAVHSRAMAEVNVRLRGRRLDLLIGGPPCQGFSTAGNNVADDSRNRLVFAFVAAVERLEPRTVLMENVPALTWRGRHSVLDEVRRRLHGLGYDTAVKILHAEGYGVPQLRRRLFLQAFRDSCDIWPAPTHKILVPNNLRYQPSAGVGVVPPRTVRDAIGDLPLETAPDLDGEIDHYGSPPATDFQRWARGQETLDRLAPASASSHDVPRLELPA